MVNYDELRSRLENDKKRLNHELELLKADTGSTAERREGSPFGKREEEATEAAALETRLELEKGVRDQLASVEHALSKIEQGTYGLCDVCGKPINPERLGALPHANLCLTCKANQAKNAKGR